MNVPRTVMDTPGAASQNTTPNAAFDAVDGKQKVFQSDNVGLQPQGAVCPVNNAISFDSVGIRVVFSSYVVPRAASACL
jgi:hypothetical protein